VRAVVAHHWRLDPFALRRYPAREFRVMAEARDRMVREHNEQVERAQSGGLAPTPKPRKKGQPADW
jgi:hypothetical protein